MTAKVSYAKYTIERRQIAQKVLGSFGALTPLNRLCGPIVVPLGYSLSLTMLVLLLLPTGA